MVVSLRLREGYRNQFRKGLIDRLNFTEKKGIFTAFITSIFYYDFSSVYRAYLALFPSFSFKLWGLSLLWFWLATFLSSYKHGSNLTWIGYRDEKTGTLKRVTYRIVQVEMPGRVCWISRGISSRRRASFSDWSWIWIWRNQNRAVTKEAHSLMFWWEIGLGSVIVVSAFQEVVSDSLGGS